MTLLATAMAFLIASHVLPLAPHIRTALLEGLGRRGFYTTYSTLSLVALGLVVLAYRAAAPGPWLYIPVPGSRVLALIGMMLGIFLLIGRLTTQADPATPLGIYRLFAAPSSLAVLLWALLHLLNLGETRQVVVFSGMALIAAVALIKNLGLAPPAYREVGLFRGTALRQGEFRRELGWRRPALGLLVYFALLGLHPVVIGRDPLAGLL
ncbi:MAG: hypothetical protein K0S35_2738 [Geminicoccaceae bacterium]|jgi:uncharacterized membrane protein|nr:hypothetical protein [Geminicoccaceae bacterium]